MYNEPEGMRQIHEIQEKIYEKTKNMGIDEKIMYARLAGEEVAKKYNLRLRKIRHLHTRGV